MSATTLLLLAAVAVLASAVHAAVGFGSGPLLVPALLLAVEPASTVVAAVLVGMLVNVVQLTGERRRPRLAARALAPLWLGAPPGAAAGALAAGRLDAEDVALAVAGALLLCAAAALARPRVRPPAPALVAGGALAGFSAALTGVFGPLLGVLLLSTGRRGDELRDGIGASFLAVGACAVAAGLVVTPSWEGVRLAAVLAPPALLGHALGRRGFAQLGQAAHRATVLLAVLVGCGAALARALG